MQTRMLGAVACVSPAHPPNRAALGRWSVPCAPMMVSGAGIERGVCRGQKSKMQGCRCHAWTLGSGGPRLTEFRSIASCPMAVCAVGRQALSGATKGATGVCGAHERPPGRMWRPGSGFGFRSSNFVHPDARKFALGCVAIRKKGGAPVAAGPPPPCGRARAASCGGGAGAGVEAAGPGRGGGAGIRRGERDAGCRHPASARQALRIEAPSRAGGGAPRRNLYAPAVEAAAVIEAPSWSRRSRLAGGPSGREGVNLSPTYARRPLVSAPAWERDHGQA